jgi:hypothetical protein
MQDDRRIDFQDLERGYEEYYLQEGKGYSKGRLSRIE